jgi:hypothetical protein
MFKFFNYALKKLDLALQKTPPFGLTFLDFVATRNSLLYLVNKSLILAENHM